MRDMETREKIRLGQGVWVPNDEMNPYTNIAGRYYYDKHIKLHKYISDRIDPPAIAWFFPDEDE